MKFPHLQGREKLLEPLGFTGLQAEWITLVCLHSGLFTRDQVEAFLGTSRTTSKRFLHALLDARVSGRPVAAATVIDGRHICRIYGKAIYRELGITNVRHRRESSIEVTRRRLLSLDFVLDHPDLPWLATEQEKVACFEQLGIDPALFPKRIYTGRANGRVRYFHIKMPIAVEPERATFIYIDPGMGTHTELHSWGAAHRALWEKAPGVRPACRSGCGRLGAARPRPRRPGAHILARPRHERGRAGSRHAPPGYRRYRLGHRRTPRRP